MLLLACSMPLNVTLAAFAMHMAGAAHGGGAAQHQTRPWVGVERVSAAHLEQMAYFIPTHAERHAAERRPPVPCPAPVSPRPPPMPGTCAALMTNRCRARQARGAPPVVQRAGPVRRRAHPARVGVRGLLTTFHQRPPRLRSLEGLRHRAPVRRRRIFLKAFRGDQSQ